MENFYDHPEYYDLAFSWRDMKKEVDVFEECFRRYSGIPVRRVLELASGTSPHLEELSRRGYHYTGLDLNKAMVLWSESKARRLGIDAAFIEGDMAGFCLPEPVDFVFTMCGSLYVHSTAELLSHLNSVARALKPGGLYFLDWCINFEWNRAKAEQKWEIERGGVKIGVRFNEKVLDTASQTAEYRLEGDIEDGGRRLHLESVDTVRVVLPQEFRLLVEKCGMFEFMGWWNYWDLDRPMEEEVEVSRPITLIRRIETAGGPISR
jgi:SAM-dependent methyltransferase